MLLGLNMTLSHSIFLLLLFGTSAQAQTRTLAERKQFAEKMRARFGPIQMPKKLTDTCFEYRAPPALKCNAVAYLCSRESSSSVCSGSFTEAEGLVLYDHRPQDDETDPLPELILSSVSGDECPECDCSGETTLAFAHGVSPARQARARIQFELDAAKEHKRCVVEAAKRQRRERVTRHCELLFVDPCRHEAFLRCSGKNGSVEAGDAPLGRTLLFSFSSTDAGVSRGGEWQSEPSLK
jgi:hypothetical protein